MSITKSNDIPVRNKIRSTEVIMVPSSASYFTVTVPDVGQSHKSIELVIPNNCSSSDSSSSSSGKTIDVPCNVDKVDVDLNKYRTSETVKLAVDLCCPNSSSSSVCPIPSSSSSSSSSSVCPIPSSSSSSSSSSVCPIPSSESSCSSSFSSGKTIDVPCNVNRVDINLNKYKTEETVKLAVDLCCPSNSSSSVPSSGS